jgi:hypothetical protein
MASKSYQASETSTVWTSAGGDKLLDLGSLGFGTVKMGAYLDLGVAPRSDWYEVVVRIGGFTGGTSVQLPIECRFLQSNSTTGFDGNPTTDPTASAAGVMTLQQMWNCKMIGTVLTVSSSSSDVLQCRYRVRLTGRYVAPVVYNRTDATISVTGTDHSITLTPIPQEGQ